MYCSNCGSWIPDNCKFCPECGTPVNAEASDNSYQTYATADADEASSTYLDDGSSYGYESSESTPAIPYSDVTIGPGSAGPLKDDRDIIVFVLLSIVTCGIYGFYFVYKMAEDANAVCADDGDTTPGLAVYLLLSIATCGIYSYWWEYKLANRLKLNGRRYGLDIMEGGSDVLMWLILGLFTWGICSYFAAYILIKNMNLLSAAYNQRYFNY
jgi:hypothetical protein